MTCRKRLSRKSPDLSKISSLSITGVSEVPLPLHIFSMEIVSEGAKEVIFGGLAGLTAGYVSRKLGSHLVGAALTSGFVVFRAAVYDGQYLATWSPLARDSTDFTQHLKRKARREAFSVGKRLEDFSQQNFLILGGYVGAYMMGSAR